jgi:hypothetical protein
MQIHLAAVELNRRTLAFTERSSEERSQLQDDCQMNTHRIIAGEYSWLQDDRQ